MDGPHYSSQIRDCRPKPDCLSGLTRHLMDFSPVYVPAVCFNHVPGVCSYEVIKLRFRHTALVLMETCIMLVAPSPTIWSTKHSRFHLGVFRPHNGVSTHPRVSSGNMFPWIHPDGTGEQNDAMMPWCLPNARMWVVSKKKKESMCDNEWLLYRRWCFEGPQLGIWFHAIRAGQSA